MKVYTTGDIAHMLKITDRTVERWCKAGYLESTRVPSPGGKSAYRITEEQLDAFINKCRS